MNKTNIDVRNLYELLDESNTLTKRLFEHISYSVQIIQDFDSIGWLMLGYGNWLTLHFNNA